MMTSSNGNIFRVTGHLCGDFTGPRWIPRTKVSDAELRLFSLIFVWINGWINNREAGDLRRYRAHYDVTVMCVRNLMQRWTKRPMICSILIFTLSFIYKLNPGNVSIQQSRFSLKIKLQLMIFTSRNTLNGIGMTTQSLALQHLMRF